MFDPNPTSIPGLAEFVPRCTLLLDDISGASNESLRRKAIAAFPTLALWLLRDARDPARMFANFGSWVSAFHEVLRAQNGVEAVALLLRYIALVCDEHFDTFREILRKQLPEAEQAAMTIAEQLRQEGRQEGRQEERFEMLERVLLRKFKQIPPEYVSRITSVTEDQLDLYIDRILTARTIDEVFE